MTVGEAIEELKKFPEDMDIVIVSDETPEFVLTEDTEGYKCVEIWEKDLD